MLDLLILGIVCLVVALAVFYIIREKKRGVTCIGCSAKEGCSRKCQQNCSHK